MRITIDDVKSAFNGVTETYDIVNAIFNSNDATFKDVPRANAKNIADVGAGIMINQTVQNEFITTLVDRIGLVVVRNVSLNNPFKKFKKGMMPLGRTIEEIFVDITQEKKYDPVDAEETLFKREIPNVKTLFHERNRQGMYQQTIQDDSIKTAFISWGHFDNFLTGIINAIYNSAELDEYKYMKLLIDNYYSKGHFKVVPIDKITDETSAKKFIKKARATTTKMTLGQGTRDYNSLAVHTRSDINDLHLFIDADLEAEIDVDVLAKAFNMDRANFLGNVTVIDGFSSTGLEAVLVDKDFFMVYDTVQKMETVRNPKGLYWNYFYHVWQILSVSRFANAVAFVSDPNVAPVTEVIVTPAIASIKQGGSQKFDVHVRVTDPDFDGDVTWDVSASDGGAVETGTTIDSDGKLTVDSGETAELKVKATVTYNDGDDDVDVVGESVVTVITDI